MAQARVAIIGGSGFYRLEGLQDIEEVRIKTPFGEPSDAIAIGTLEGQRVAFLSRHGVGHRLLPSEVPALANIYALKLLGVEFLIGVSAVGSLRDEVKPLDMVIPDQLVDRTWGRPSTFFGRGLVAHVAFADPFCPTLSTVLYEAARETRSVVHRGGTLVAMEGPAFSTRAESNLHRSWGASLIVMTVMPEAKLAREAEMCYALLACVTDYDAWRGGEEAVTVAIVLENLAALTQAAQRAVTMAVQRLPATRHCACAEALKNALITPPHLVPPCVKEELAPIIGRYMPAEPGSPAGGTR